MNDHTSGQPVTIYHGYELKIFSDIFQSYLVSNQQIVSYLPYLELAHIFHLWLQTSKLLCVILYRLKLDLQAMVFSNQ